MQRDHLNGASKIISEARIYQSTCESDLERKLTNGFAKPEVFKTF